MMVFMIIVFFGLGSVLIYTANYHGEAGYQRFKKMWIAAIKEGSHSYRERLEEDHPIHFLQLREEMILHKE